MLVRKLLKPFRFAVTGIKVIFLDQLNFRLHLLATAIVICLGLWLPITNLEWIILVFCIGIVLAAEAFNSSIEYICDALHPQHHPLIGKAKDAAAAAVLLLSIMATIVGALIFIPKIAEVL